MPFFPFTFLYSFGFGFGFPTAGSCWLVTFVRAARSCGILHLPFRRFWRLAFTTSSAIVSHAPTATWMSAKFARTSLTENSKRARLTFQSGLHHPWRGSYYRHISKGAWPFSTRDHGWPISDCTSEGIKCVLLLQKLPYIDEALIEPERLYEAVNVVLSMQNTKENGQYSTNNGWATYELQVGNVIRS